MPNAFSGTGAAEGGNVATTKGRESPRLNLRGKRGREGGAVLGPDLNDRAISERPAVFGSAFKVGCRAKA